jgi:hypothetical protein
MVKLCFSRCGICREIVVPFVEARRVNKRLWEEGAAVFWTERL